MRCHWSCLVIIVAVGAIASSCGEMGNPAGMSDAQQSEAAYALTKPAKSSVLDVPGEYATIQDAVDAASDGAVIKGSPGIYQEQVEIRDLDDLNIWGDQAIITVPEGGMMGPLVKIVNCEAFQLTGFTIDGDNGASVTPGRPNAGGDSDTRFYGLLVVNSSGHIVKNTIKDVSWGNGAQQGLGIYAQVRDGVARDINIRENAVTNFQKNGITIRAEKIAARKAA